MGVTDMRGDKKRNIKFNWICNARQELLDKEILLKMKDAGCKSIALGLESANACTLKQMNKNIDISIFKDTVELIKKVGIGIRVNIMIGFPGESLSMAKNTLMFARALKPNAILLFVTAAYPGTELYRDAVNKKLIQDRWYLEKLSTDITLGRLKNNAFVPDKFSKKG
mgnify:CR=1 FL=1